jgi:hypothetical protein
MGDHITGWHILSGAKGFELRDAIVAVNVEQGSPLYVDVDVLGEAHAYRSSDFQGTAAGDENIPGHDLILVPYFMPIYWVNAWPLIAVMHIRLGYFSKPPSACIFMRYVQLAGTEKGCAAIVPHDIIGNIPFFFSGIRGFSGIAALHHTCKRVIKTKAVTYFVEYCTHIGIDFRDFAIFFHPTVPHIVHGSQIVILPFPYTSVFSAIKPLCRKIFICHDDVDDIFPNYGKIICPNM